MIKQTVLLIGLAMALGSCANNEGSSRSSESTDTTKNITTNVGAAGTGGVGAGFGSGGSAGVDTNTLPGTVIDTTKR